MKKVLLLLLCLQLKADNFIPFFLPSGSVIYGNHLLPDLIAFYRFDEASGNAIDASGNGRTLTDVSADIGSEGGVVNDARILSYVDTNYFERSYDAGFAFSGPFTITCWARFTDVGVEVNDMTLVAKGDYGGSNFAYLLELDSGSATDYIAWYWSEDGIFAPGNRLEFDLGGFVGADWYFIVFRWSGTTAHLSATYFGDPLSVDVTTPMGTPFDDGTASLRVGSLEGLNDHDLNGNIEETGFWNRYLSDCEVAWIYTAQLGSFSYPSFDSNTCNSTIGNFIAIDGSGFILYDNVTGKVILTP